jgi:hypothetical protein
LTTAFGVLLVCAQVGSIIAPSLVKRSPELLLAMSSRMRHLLFAVPADINPVTYAVIGFLRLSAAAWVCYLLGAQYGSRGVAWMERQLEAELPATFRFLQRAAQRWSAAVAFVLPGSNIACALLGERGMSKRRFGFWLSAGIAFRLIWLWIAAKQFESQLKDALDWIDAYQWWLVGAFFVITFAQAWWKASRQARREL